MTELLLTSAGILVGVFLGWFAHEWSDIRRKRKEIEAWHHTRKFFSSRTTKT